MGRLKFLSSLGLIVFIMSLISLPSYAGKCDYPDQLDSAGRRCGGRAASVRRGGHLGGNGSYQDSQGRNRIYGKDNDPYDSNVSKPALVFDNTNMFQPSY